MTDIDHSARDERGQPSAVEARRIRCAVCAGATFQSRGRAKGRLDDRAYELRRCSTCGFLFVGNPRTDYDLIYSEDYYRGRGADPKLNYVDEAENPDDSVRSYEWRGIFRRVADLVSVGPTTSWLDFGCGTGGFVRYLRRQGIQATGYEHGWPVQVLDRLEVPHIAEEDLLRLAGSFDVITAVEVIEHVVDPIELLRTIRRLLRPGGLLFLTTGNAAPFRSRLQRWPYVTPEVHISYFEPINLALALNRAGLTPAAGGYGPGWEDIFRFKLLMSLRVKKRHPSLERLVPWSVLALILDRSLQLSHQPIGWARG